MCCVLRCWMLIGVHCFSQFKWFVCIQNLWHLYCPEFLTYVEICDFEMSEMHVYSVFFCRQSVVIPFEWMVIINDIRFRFGITFVFIWLDSKRHIFFTVSFWCLSNQHQRYTFDTHTLAGFIMTNETTIDDRRQA